MAEESTTTTPPQEQPTPQKNIYLGGSFFSLKNILIGAGIIALIWVGYAYIWPALSGGKVVKGSKILG